MLHLSGLSKMRSFDSPLFNVPDSPIFQIDAKDSLRGAINGLVELIKPAVAQSKGAAGDALENAIRKNVEISVERLKELQPILEPRVKDGKLKVVGAINDLRAGAVTLVERGS
jgi:carbonic anhydrase